MYFQARTLLARMAAKGAKGAQPQVAVLFLVQMVVEMVEMMVEEMVEMVVMEVLAACREAEQHWVAE